MTSQSSLQHPEATCTGLLCVLELLLSGTTVNCLISTPQIHGACCAQRNSTLTVIPDTANKKKQKTKNSMNIKTQYLLVRVDSSSSLSSTKVSNTDSTLER